MDFFKIHSKIIIPLIIFATILLVVFYNIYQATHIEEDSLLINQNPQPSLQSEKPNKIYVDIKGCVNSPGVYEVDEHMIVNDIIDLAGGLTNNADTTNINLASEITNGMLLYIPSIKEKESTSKTNQTKISINNATIKDLTTLPGIGPSKAENIISYRQANGRFTKLEELKNVKGIGESIYEKLKDKITL